LPTRDAAFPCKLQLSGGKLEEGQVIAKVKWHPGELYPRVGVIVTNMARRAKNVVAFYNKRGTCDQWIKEEKGAIKWIPFVRRQRRLSSAACAGSQSRQFPAHAGDAGTDQGLGDDGRERELIKIVTGFGVPEHHGDGSALPRLVQSGNLNLEIWSSGGCRFKVSGVLSH
jgi:hypothetical protein